MSKGIPVLVNRIILGLLFTLLFVSLFRLQVIKGNDYKRIAESNFVRIRRITATRGEIYDRKYRSIVTNIPSHNLYLISGRINSIDTLGAFLYLNFGITKQELHDLIFKQRFRTYEEILLVDNIPYEAVLALSEQLNYYPELVVRNGNTRQYLYPNHFTGYVGRINEDEFKRYQEEDYSLNAYLGKTGLEKYYEVLLRGMDGKEIVQVDSRGKSLELFRDNQGVAPLNGLSLVLSIDNDLQEFASSVFPEGRRGAIVVTDIPTGGILAYISKPDYDPNVFMQRIDPELWKHLNRPEKPLLDRVCQSAYPPGSVFKPLTAAEGLESGVITRNTLLASCAGGMKIGTRFFKCWTSAGHGRTSVVDALKVSCDVFFYDLINRMNLDETCQHTRKVGMLDKTGIDLPNERNGFYPDTQWYHNRLGRSSGLQGYKANLAIGQGEVLTTPLQINAFFAAIARGGVWIQPHLMVKTMGRGRLERDQVQPIIKRRYGWSAATVSAIQDGLWAVSNAPGGTGRALHVPGAQSFGKTGSAENAMGKTTHAWFSAYIVTDKPEIAVTVFLENAGGGGAVAAPICNKIMNYYVGNLESFKAPVVVPKELLDLEPEVRPEVISDTLPDEDGHAVDPPPAPVKIEDEH